jgi:hypothetical protein
MLTDILLNPRAVLFEAVCAHREPAVQSERTGLVADVGWTRASSHRVAHRARTVRPALPLPRWRFTTSSTSRPRRFRSVMRRRRENPV